MNTRLSHCRTIGEFIEAGRLSFYCATCQAPKDINLRKLGELLGMDFDLCNTRIPMKCAACRSLVDLKNTIGSLDTKQISSESPDWLR